MFKKFLDLLVAHVKAELLAWAEAEFEKHLAQFNTPTVPVPEESQG